METIAATFANANSMFCVQSDPVLITAFCQTYSSGGHSCRACADIADVPNY